MPVKNSNGPAGILLSPVLLPGCGPECCVAAVRAWFCRLVPAGRLQVAPYLSCSDVILARKTSPHMKNRSPASPDARAGPELGSSARRRTPRCKRAPETRNLRMKKQFKVPKCVLSTEHPKLRGFQKSPISTRVFSRLLPLLVLPHKRRRAVMQTLKCLFIDVHHVPGRKELILDVLLQSLRHGQVLHLIGCAEVQRA